VDIKDFKWSIKSGLALERDGELQVVKKEGDIYTLIRLSLFSSHNYWSGITKVVNVSNTSSL
jgi:hypothetical protein